MPNELTYNAIEAMTAPETDAVFLTLLKISIDGVESLFFVDDKQSLTHNGQEFIPWAFTALLPDQTSDGVNTCRLQIDNTDIAIYKTIKSAIGKEITVDVAIVLSSTPNDIERGWLHFVLRNLKINAQSITGELYDFYMSDRKFCGLTYNPSDFPGLFY